MALVSYVSNQDASEKIKPVFEGMEKKIGAVPNVFRAMAHNPEMLEAFLALNGTLPKTKLNGKLHGWPISGSPNGCDYCLHHHRGLGKKAGLNDRQVAETAQYETSDAYDELEREVMRFAEEVTRHINVTDAVYNRQKQKQCDRELIEHRHDRGHRQFHESCHRNFEVGAAVRTAEKSRGGASKTGRLSLPCIESGTYRP